MKPIAFSESNCVYAKDQPEYLPLPTYKTADGAVTACWGLSLRERLMLLWTGRLWFQVLTFNQPLQPQYPTVKKSEVIT